MDFDPLVFASAICVLWAAGALWAYAGKAPYGAPLCVSAQAIFTAIGWWAGLRNYRAPAYSDIFFGGYIACVLLFVLVLSSWALRPSTPLQSHIVGVLTVFYGSQLVLGVLFFCAQGSPFARLMLDWVSPVIAILCFAWIGWRLTGGQMEGGREALSAWPQVYRAIHPVLRFVNFRVTGR